MTTKKTTTKKTKTATPGQAGPFISKTPLKTMAPLFKLVEKRNSIPVLGCIKAQGGIATATDMDMELSVACDLPDGLYLSTGLEFCLKHGEPVVKAEYPLEDFPKLEGITGQTQTPVKFKLAELDSVCFAMSCEETRYYLNGVNYEAMEDGTYNMVCTDGHRLAALSKGDGKVKASGMLPRKLVHTMLGISKESDVEGSLTSSKFTAQIGPYTVFSKLIDGTFPDYRRVIPSGNDKRVVIKDVAALVKKEKERRKAFNDEGIAMKIVIVPEEKKAGKIVQAEELMGFKPDYLGESAGKSKDITLLVSDATSPAIIEGGRAPLGVLMPMRV